MSALQHIIKYFEEGDSKKRERRSFWATDAEKPVFDLYHAWIGTPETDPPSAEKRMMWGVAKMVEDKYGEVLDRAGVTIKPNEGLQHRIEIHREGVPISGYLDRLLEGNIPWECKTVYGPYAAKELEQGVVSTAYLKQLAIYMDALGAEKGVLFYVDRGTGAVYEFPVFRDGELKFRCNDLHIDLSNTYKRFAIVAKFIADKKEPPREFVYKHPIEKVDWMGLPKGVISDARNNHAVYGDWQAKYSFYKSLYIEREGTTLGYTDEELAYIRKATAGYTSKKRN